MSDNVTHIPGARRRKLRHRLLIMAGVVLLVAALAALYFFSDGPAGQSQEDAAISVSGAVMESFSFDAHSSNEYAAFNGGLAVASVSGLSVYAADGAESCVLQTTMTTPRVLSCGEAVMAYDVGGYNLMAVGKKGTELLNVTAAKPILDADLSPDGYACYSTSESGYKSILYVYNPRGAMIYRWLSSSQYLPICTVSPEAFLRAVWSFFAPIPRRSTAPSRLETSCFTIWNFLRMERSAPSARAARCGCGWTGRFSENTATAARISRILISAAVDF